MRWLIYVVLLTAPTICLTQDAELILLNNPSFEDLASPSRPPLSWFFCGNRDESPPDIQPNGIFGPTPPPAHGKTYLGMVARDNGTYESVGQRLLKPMKGGACYRWTVQALRAPHYISTSRDNPITPSDYNNPLILRIWGGNAVCDHAELLSQSPPILDTNWQSLEFILQPNTDYSFLILEAYYYKRIGDQYNGNIMLDQASPVLPIDCETRQELSPITPLAMPDISSTEELKRWLGSMGSQLRFSSFYDRLEHSYFQVASGQCITGNAVLWQILAAMASFPELELQIGIPAANRQQYQDRMIAVLLEIREMGFPEQNLHFTRVRRKRSGEDWLNSGTDDALWLRLRE